MHYRADVSEPDPSPIIISKYLSEPGPTRRVPTGSDGLGSGIHPLVGTYECGACENLLTVLDMIFACEQRSDFCGGGVGSTAPPCVVIGQLSPSGGRRLALALPAASGMLPRGLGCALGRARSWLLLRCRLRGGAEGVFLPVSGPGWA